MSKSNTTIAGTITVNKANPKISWSPSSFVYGRILASTDLNATATGVKNDTLSGTFSYAYTVDKTVTVVKIGDLLNAGSYSITVTFTPSSKNYNSGTATATLVITQSSLTMAFNATTITYGDVLTSTQLNATAKDFYGNLISGIATYINVDTKEVINIGDTLDAGTVNVSVSFVPTSPKNYNI